VNLPKPLAQPAATPDADLVQIGIGDDGKPLYAYRQTAPTVMPAQLVQRPWAAYAAGGCGLLLALLVVAFTVVAIVIGFAIALGVLAVCMLALTICAVVLRSLVKDMRKG
jgi:hypothetical protein